MSTAATNANFYYNARENKVDTDVNARDHTGRTLLMYAASLGKLRTVKHLVEERGAKLNMRTRGYTALSYAAVNNEMDVVEYLLDQGALPSARGFELTFAAKQGYTEIFNMLVAYFI